MSLIRELKHDDTLDSTKGVFTSTSLFAGEMRLEIFSDAEGATVEYAEKCIRHYNALNENTVICEQLQEKLEKFFLYMYDEWKEMGFYDDIVADLEKVMEEYKSGKKLIEFLYRPTMYIYAPEGDAIGYCIESECPWEPEHQCNIIIRDDKLLYVGPSEGETPWGDEDDYYCIWEDED